ncbi:MAG: YciI family protein [Pyrinomonadaceae bacterium]
MKIFRLSIILGIALSIFTLSAYAQNVKAEGEAQFDADLAKKLGADDYGMRSYVMVVLKTGPNDSKITDKAQRDKLFAGHFGNMKRLAEEGKLVFAGPLSDDAPKRGLFIFAVTSFEDAEALVKTDPTVKEGIFVYDMTKLYGSAALMQVNEMHKKVQKTSF